jgi:hypothetical protein
MGKEVRRQKTEDRIQEVRNQKSEVNPETVNGER